VFLINQINKGVKELNQGKRILIIEDDQEISMLLSFIMRKAKLEPVAAYSGTEGLLQLQNKVFDLILLDLMLPGKTGEELIKEIRKESSIPIIVISAKVDIEDKVQVLKMGADDYITKPFHQEEVLARVEVQLRKAAVKQVKQTEIQWRGLAINKEKRLATLNGKELQLTNAEFEILSFFVSIPCVPCLNAKFMKISGKELIMAMTIQSASTSPTSAKKLLRLQMKNILRRFGE